MSIPKINETPAQKIKRLEQELSDERLKNEILNRMIYFCDVILTQRNDILSAPYGQKVMWTGTITHDWIQSQTDRDRFDDTTKCILCAACTTSCPVFWNDGQYFGPAAIVNAHRFIFDSRDEGAAQRLEVLNDKEGVWRCRTTFNCTEACPRGIEVTKAIAEVKQAVLRGRP